MRNEDFSRAAGSYYTRRFQEHGATAAGVDWSSRESQELRFVQLLKVTDSHPGALSLIDYGCGFGALATFLEPAVEYRGFDVSEPMIEYARQEHVDSSRVFTTVESELDTADFAVASGVFNVKQSASADEWQEYVVAMIARLDALSTDGFAFNMLTSYSDTDRMRDDLYYGDPLFFFDLCKRRFARNVALLHDYGLYEFTLLVRKSIP